ncbi:MAG: helix-turn-helix transcriptional regulator [Ruminococcaceae bacterium]|nr:helix-turn-helix transcriptional regulator [Oscillospiraceae bacterium]
MDLKNIVVTDLVNVITVHSPKGRVQPMVQRKYYGISFCISGQITYTQNGKSYVSDCDHAVILPQGATYTVTGDKTGDFPVINFTVQEPFCDTVTVIAVKKQDYLLHLYEQIRKLSFMHGSRAKQMSLFYDMIDTLAEERRPYRLLPALQYLENHYQEETLTNALLAKECRISEVYFRKLFTGEFGVSPKQYIIELRMERAKQLLCEGARGTAEISELCGFASPYHFCRLFKQHTGMTPSEYRAANQILHV